MITALQIIELLIKTVDDSLIELVPGAEDKDYWNGYKDGIKDAKKALLLAELKDD